MPRGQGRYPESKVREYLAMRELGVGNDKACAEMGIDRKTGWGWWSTRRRELMRDSTGMPAPKTRAQIRAHTAARKALDDFVYFRRICFGRTTSPWQVDAAEKIRDAIESRRREFAVINVFPGAGKTLLLQDIVCWLIVRNRTIRILWGSASDELATRRTNEIRMELMRTAPGEGNEEDIASGRAVKPKYCLAELFGRFRPGSHVGASWAKAEMTVAQPGAGRNEEGPAAAGPTLAAYGRRSKQLGPRAEFIVWDDAWTEDEEANVHTGAATKRWFDRTAENRLQPNGTLVLVMQRMSANDLSRYCLDKRKPILDEEGREAGFEPEYRHIVYPAHHDELCDGTHPKDRPAWDPREPIHGHCLTDPMALPPEDFVRKRAGNTFQVVYQQRDMDPIAALIREIHLVGGKDEDGFTYKGCLDLDRGLWELPDGVPKGQLVNAMSVDVGHEGYWGLYCAVHSTDKDSEEEWILIAEHRKMPSGTENGFLDFDFERRCFVGVAEDWWQHSHAIGLPITVLIAEINAAQRHLFRKTNVLDRWCMSRQVRVLSHSTFRNKNDKRIGVEAVVPIRYQLGAYRIPWRPGVTQNTMRTLFNEAKGYQQGWPTDDILMAQWMRTINRTQVARPVGTVVSRGDVPAWVTKMAR